MQVLLLFYFPKPSRCCTGQGPRSCPGFGLVSLSESEICLQGNHMQKHLCVPVCLCALSPLVCRHDLSVSQAEPGEGKALSHNNTDTFLPCHGSALLPRCWALLPEREQGGAWGLAGLTPPEHRRTPREPHRAVASSSEQSQEQVPWFLYPVFTEIFQACMI